MPEGPASAKVCTLCGEDCSSRPRVKDQQGRYFCKSCVDRRAAAKPKAPAPAPPPAEDDSALPASFWSDLPTTSNTSPCPGCGALMSNDAVICLSCGHNRQSGRKAKVKVAKAPRQRSEGPKLSMSPGLVAAIILLLFGVAFPFAIGSEAGALAYHFAASAVWLVAYIMMVVCAFKDKDTGWGITGVLSFVIPCIGLAMLYYAFAVTGRAYVKVMVATGLLVIATAFVVLTAAGVDLRGYTSSP